MRREARAAILAFDACRDPNTDDRRLDARSERDVREVISSILYFDKHPDDAGELRGVRRRAELYARERGLVFVISDEAALAAARWLGLRVEGRVINPPSAVRRPS